MNNETPIIIIKSKGEEIRVAISRFRYRDFIDFRTYAIDDDQAEAE